MAKDPIRLSIGSLDTHAFALALPPRFDAGGRVL